MAVLDDSMLVHEMNFNYNIVSDLNISYSQIGFQYEIVEATIIDETTITSEEETTE